MKVLPGSAPRMARWATTRWTLVAGLDADSPKDRKGAWEELVETYRPAMVAFVARALSRVPADVTVIEDPEDVVQGFLLACIEKPWLQRANRAKGRFRVFTRTLLRRWVLQRLRFAQARKRSPGPERKVLRADRHPSEDLPAPDLVADAAFDREWVRIALERALERLRRKGRRDYEIVRDLIATGGAGSADVAALIGLDPKRLPLSKFRARACLARLLAEELADTVGDPAALDEEWRALRPYLP